MITEKTLNLIKHYEGLHDGNLKKIGLQPKLCPAGIATIGYGHAVTDPNTGKFLKGAEGLVRAEELYPALTIAEAEQLLMEDCERFAAHVKKAVRVNAQPERMGAMLSFTFNLGVASFTGSTLLALVNKYMFEEAANEFPKWNKATVNGVKKPLMGLTCRRQSERLLFLTGELKFFAK